MSEPYEIEAIHPESDLPDSFVRCAADEDAIESLAADLFLQAQNCVRAFGDFHLTLDGGWASQRLCQVLLLDPQFRLLPWKRTHLWVAADRAPDAPVSASMRELLVAHADLPPEQCHPVVFEHAAGSADPAATRYASRLREHLGWREKGHDRLDFVLLQIGGGGAWNAVTTSNASQPTGLIGTREVIEHGNSTDADELPAGVSMEPRLVSSSRYLAVVALGQAASEPVGLQAAGGDPFGLAMPDGTMRWFVDDGSAGGLG
ncbi:MAG: 6-phosphogluconolactonase [Planctomycetota bacterium]